MSLFITGPIVGERMILKSEWPSRCSALVVAEAQQRAAPPPMASVDCDTVIGILMPELRALCEPVDQITGELQRQQRNIESQRLSYATKDKVSRCGPVQAGLTLEEKPHRTCITCRVLAADHAARREDAEQPSGKRPWRTAMRSEEVMTMIMGFIDIDPLSRAIHTHRDSYLLDTVTVVSVRRPLLAGGVVTAVGVGGFGIIFLDLLFPIEIVCRHRDSNHGACGWDWHRTAAAAFRADLRGSELSGAVWGSYGALNRKTHDHRARHQCDQNDRKPNRTSCR